MKKNTTLFDPRIIARIKTTLLSAGISGGPGNEALKNEFFAKYPKKEKLFFWLDDTVQQFVSLNSIAIDPKDDGGKTLLILGGTLEYGNITFSFSMSYDSFHRHGIGEFAKGFTSIELLIPAVSEYADIVE